MTPDDWEQINALFAAAVELDQPQRAAYLDAHCDSADVRQQVHKMLAADANTAAELDGIVGDATRSSFGQTIDPGDLIGAYRVVREIDRGGMGAVYLAEREDSYSQQVAIKVVNVALAGSNAVARFESERQILAKLEHANIAHLIDGGTTPAGIPYLVMEYVDGEPIDSYCDNHRLTTEQRLDLFMQICSALHFAHQNLVVHRDIKPGNILVTDAGVPKLLDFGIAKLLDDDGAGNNLTRAHNRVLTPEYASPEQVLGRPITTASDTYSLGVLLYRLLTGLPPYRFDDFAAQTMAKIICDSQPDKPSSVTATLNDGTAQSRAILRARDTTRPQLRRALRGDLDNIVLMAMRKEPDRRYASVLRMADDISNYLRHRPVSARTDSFAYRTSKFVQRNRAAAAATVVAVVGLIVVVSFYTARLSSERDRAQLEARKAVQTAEFLQDLFRVADPEVSGGGDVTARSLLDQGARQLEVSLADQPDVQASLQATIASVYKSLGLFDEAQPLFDRALQTQIDLHSENHEDVAATLRRMAELTGERGEHEQAVAMARRALAISEAVHGERHVSVAASKSMLGLAHFRTGEYALAQSLQTEARNIYEDIGATDSQAYLITLNRLGEVLEFNGRFDEAMELLEFALAKGRATNGRIHPTTIALQTQLAVLQDRRNRFDEAEINMLEAHDATQALYGKDHPHMSVMQSALARIYRHKKDLEKSALYAEAALATSKRAYGDDHEYVGYDTIALAKFYASDKNFAKAEEYFLAGLAIYAKAIPEDHPYVAAALVGYGQMLIKNDRLTEARAVLERGRRICAAKLPADHWLTAQMDILMGATMTRLDEAQAGAELLQDGLQRLIAARGENNPGTLYAVGLMLEYLRENDGDADELSTYTALQASIEKAIETR